MNNNDQFNNKYRTIGEITKKLGLINKKTGHLQTHTIRYWETQFKQIKPVIRAGGRRYYSEKVFKVIKFIQFLLKDKGLTINGARKILNNTESRCIDDDVNMSINKPNLNTTKIIKNKIKNISRIIKELKKIK